MQESVELLDTECSEGGGIARAGADDVFAVGHPDVVLPAIQRFAAEVEERCSLRLQWTKSKVYIREGPLPANTPPGLSLAGEQVGDQFLRGTMVYGVPVGSPEFISYKLKEKAEEIIRDANKTREVLATDPQSLWTALRLSVQQRFQYLMQLTPPSLCEPVAAELDAAIWRILEAACGFPVPRGAEEGGLELLIPAIPSLSQRSFQEWAVRLPARLYGWGLRSLEDSCGPAYLATLETAIPYMAGRGKVCPQLAGLWGGEECWGEDAPEESRWRQVLDSNSSVGMELRRCWDKLQLEANQSAAWLGEEVSEVFRSPVEGVGKGSVSGATRKSITEAVENTRAKVLVKALDLVRPKSTRAAWAWRQRDKVSSAWLLAIPGPDTTLTSAEFREAAATNLCLPSPACAGRVGETVKGQKKIDKYGDNIQATPLCGDHWRRRHDLLVQFVDRSCMWAGVPAEREVFNLFSGAVRQQGLSRMEAAKQRQSLVPDLRIAVQPLAVAEAEVARGRPARGLGGAVEGGVLHEVKIISCNKTRYKPTLTKRAVDIRAGKLQQEYVVKAREADRVHNHTPVGTVGAVERKLVELGEVHGIVAGNFGEVSEQTHSLMAFLATSRVRVAGPSRGRRGHLRTEEGERAMAISALRRRLGVLTVRCQALSLLGRLEVLGPGTAAAAGRRWHAGELERCWRREQQADNLARLSGHLAYRSGFARID